jgi:FKBP-type peptidyl-prolyl cis-trans isomerase FklB
MKFHPFILTGLALASINTTFAQEVKLETTEQKAGYIIGGNIARQLKSQPVQLDTEAVVAGLRAGLAGDKAKFTQEETEKIMKEMQDLAMAGAKKAGEANATKGKEFLATNGKREGVTTTPSGLQYEVLKKGEGKKPTKEETVKVHYHGTLIDGKVFDSSVQRGEPAEFGVGQVIPGWTEALQLMPVGSKWKLFIPSEIAYGDRGAGGDIGPGATLIFEVELLDIVK